MASGVHLILTAACTYLTLQSFGYFGVEAVKCYECEINEKCGSGTLPLEADPCFDPKKSKVRVKNCKKGCVKYVRARGPRPEIGRRPISRGCGSGENKCFQDLEPRFVSTCFCNTDLCNGSPGMTDPDPPEGYQEWVAAGRPSALRPESKASEEEENSAVRQTLPRGTAWPTLLLLCSAFAAQYY